MPRLVAEKGPEEGKDFEIGDKVSIGRRSENEIPIRDIGASRVHAEVFREEDDFYIRDLKSRNGTLVNGEPISECRLNPGDRITIGNTVLAFTFEAPKSKWVGKTLEGYEIVEFLGKGGMGSVYKARQISMERFISLKILNEKLVADKEFIERFLQEAKAAGRLNHPNIIQVIDVAMSDGTYFFSMEYVDGPTVNRILKKQKDLSVDETLEIIFPMADALHYAHRNSLIHRDVKPDNIMINSDGQVKLADLGLARNPDEDMVDLINGKRIVWGTPTYMSPEQAMGNKLDGRSDLYSLGATWYQMLAAVPPYSGSTGPEIMQQHINAPLPSLLLRNAEVPLEICTMVEKLLYKNPDDRYQSGEELAAEIRSYRRQLRSRRKEAPINSPGLIKRLVGDSTLFR